MRRALVAGAVLLAAFAGSAASAETLSSYWARTAPTIDGAIQWDEWAGAAHVAAAGVPAFTFYAKSDETHLYVAYDVTGDTTNDNDFVSVYFDLNNDNAYPAACGDMPQEGYYILYRNGNRRFFQRAAGGVLCGTTETTAFVGASSIETGHQVYELAVDLAAEPFAAEPGETIGFAVSAADVSTGEQFWPATAVPGDPANWADFTFAVAPEEVDVPWANYPPVINGACDAAEWQGALAISLGPVGVTSATAYYLADGRYLYGAFVTNDATSNAYDQIMLFFDNNYNGGWPETPADEGNYYLYYSAGDLVAEFRPLYEWGLAGATTPAGSAAGALSMETGCLQFEFAIDRWGGEMGGAPAEPIGLYMNYYNIDTGDLAEWPDNVASAFDIGRYGRFNLPELGNPPISPVWTNAPPNIDGTFDAGEWDDAFVVPVRGELDYDAYFLGDAKNLYVAFDVLDDATLEDADMFAFYFDNNSDGAWPVSCGPEGRYSVAYHPGGNDYRFQAVQAGVGVCSDAATTGLTAAFALGAKSNLQIEAQLALTDGEMTGAPGATIGAQVYVEDALGADAGSWPHLLDPFDVAHYAKLTFPECAGCDVGTTCYANGAANPANECEWCDTSASVTDWSSHDGVACTSDGLFCTGEETCAAGACVSPGDPCAADETCNETADRCDRLAHEGGGDDDSGGGCGC